MPKSMEDRKKACPLMAKWAKIKGAHKALKSGKLFQPDIEPKLKDYDDIFPEYDKLNDQKDKLKDMVEDLKKSLAANGSKIKGWGDEIETLTSTDSPAMKDFMKLDGKDPADVISAFSDFITDFQTILSKRKGLWDQIMATGLDSLSQVKKASAEYKSKADGITKSLKDLEDSAERQQGLITNHLADFSATASDMDHDEIAKDIEGMIKSL